jgi:hypothetical protein
MPIGTRCSAPAPVASKRHAPNEAGRHEHRAQADHRRHDCSSPNSTPQSRS